MTFSLSSPAFKHLGKIPLLYTCDGRNISPPLQIKGVPEGTQSLALIMEDPDVPKYLRSDGLWDHWTVWNIPPEAHHIKENQIPKGIVEGKNTGGKIGYTGPCPPDREHRYFFKLFALDKALDLPQGASKISVLEAIKNHILAETQLIGLYKRGST